jgi:DNA-directed RNA polymerase III subunit RPC4
MIFRPKLPAKRTGVKDEAKTSANATDPAPLAEVSDRPAQRRNRKSHPEMVASGPFAQGSGSAQDKDALRAISTSHTQANRRNIPVDRKRSVAENLRLKQASNVHDSRGSSDDFSEDEEEGIQIIDMGKVAALDAMAPLSIPASLAASRCRPQGGSEFSQTDSSASERLVVDVDVGEEETMDDLTDDYHRHDLIIDEGFAQGAKFLLLQFPPLFPTFALPEGDALTSIRSDNMSTKSRRSVAFADGTRGGDGSTEISAENLLDATLPDGRNARDSTRVRDELKGLNRSSLEGQIGRLDVYSDGRVQITIGDEIVMEVTGASQSTFLQQVMHVDANTKQAVTLGNVEKKFVVAPEISMMLEG